MVRLQRKALPTAAIASKAHVSHLRCPHALPSQRAQGDAIVFINGSGDCEQPR